MRLSRTSFLYYVFITNKGYVGLAVISGIVYFIILRYLFPIPSFYSDSYTWIGAAKMSQPVSFRPVGYSKLLVLFKYFSSSDLPLIAGQYFCNLLANLFLFFTCLWFFRLRKVYKILLFALLIFNPFYLFYSNYVSSDALFNCFTVFWFTLLIWIMKKSVWQIIIINVIVLAGLFLLRYNAIFFPAVSSLAILISKQVWWKKTIFICISWLTVLLIVLYTTTKTKEYTGTKVFSAFSGWQLANNALHILHHTNIDTAAIRDKEVKALLQYSINYFDTTNQTFPDSVASAVYMWHINSPLKNYMKEYPGRKKAYFAIWNALGPIYGRFGKTLILQKPLSYVRHFVLPNTKAYFFPGLEIYESYMENVDTISVIAREYYHYRSNKTPPGHPVVYALIFEPVKYLFNVINFLFTAVAIYYFISKKYKKQARLFNQALLCYTALYIIHFLFIVLLAPSVLRYHIFILTLSFPVSLYLLQQISKPVAARRFKKTDLSGK